MSTLARCTDQGGGGGSVAADFIINYMCKLTSAISRKPSTSLKDLISTASGVGYSLWRGIQPLAWDTASGVGSSRCFLSVHRVAGCGRRNDKPACNRRGRSKPAFFPSLRAACSSRKNEFTFFAGGQLCGRPQLHRQIWQTTSTDFYPLEPQHESRISTRPLC